jgi:CheY-like chemotaxis protein
MCPDGQTNVVDVNVNVKEVPAVSQLRKIMVIDDNRDAADSLALLLTCYGFSVAVAYDGASAQMVLPSIKPALVFIDLVMPALDGTTLARTIRAENLGRNAVLVALTGWVPPSGQENDPVPLFDEVILKPISLDRLDMLLSSVF